MAQEKTPNGIVYESEAAGTAGARYFLMPKTQATKLEIEEAKKWLRLNFDVVSITVEKHIYIKKNGKTS